MTERKPGRTRDAAADSPLAALVVATSGSLRMIVVILLRGDEAGDQVFVGLAVLELLEPVIEPRLIGAAAEVVEVVVADPLLLALGTGGEAVGHVGARLSLLLDLRNPERLSV